jgi:hypothetical protein
MKSWTKTSTIHATVMIEASQFIAQTILSTMETPSNAQFVAFNGRMMMERSGDNERHG